jgi:hypothetical protein
VIVTGILIISLVVIILSKSSKITTKWFSWAKSGDIVDRIEELECMNEERNKSLVRLIQLEKEVDELKKRLRKNDLNNRIWDEFRLLKSTTREHRKRFSTNTVDLYADLFHISLDKEIPDCPERERRLENKYYRKCVKESIDGDTGIAPEMVRLIFENRFKPLPEETDTVDVAMFKEENFRKDVRGRCMRLLKLSYSHNRDEWGSLMPRDVYEGSYMATVKEDAISEGITYFRNVVEARNSSFKTMHEEYGDMFHSYESFKKFVEQRYRELY